MQGCYREYKEQYHIFSVLKLLRISAIFVRNNNIVEPFSEIMQAISACQIPTFKRNQLLIDALYVPIKCNVRIKSNQILYLYIF